MAEELAEAILIGVDTFTFFSSSGKRSKFLKGKRVTVSLEDAKKLKVKTIDGGSPLFIINFEINCTPNKNIDRLYYLLDTPKVVFQEDFNRWH
jgi:hypothetical protein